MVEGTGLENRHMGNRIEGSNPSLSADTDVSRGQRVCDTSMELDALFAFFLFLKNGQHLIFQTVFAV